jgi:hypothetical protein
VRVYSAGGALLGTQNVNIPGNGNTAVAVSGFVASGSGSVTITHGGMLGSVVANTTTIGATTGISFDSPFTTRVAWSLF